MQIGSGDVFVRRTGDVMTGGLVINSSAFPQITLNDPSGVAANGITLKSSGVAKFDLRGDGGLTTFFISDAGVADRLSLVRATGVLSLVTVPLAVIGASGSVAVGGVGANSWIQTTVGTGIAGTKLIGNYATDDTVSGSSFGASKTDSAFPLGACGAVNLLNASRYGNVGAAPGDMTMQGYNNRAVVSTVNFYWTAIGR